MKFLLHASLFTGLAVNRLKSQQLQPLAQLPGPARFAGQALTQHLPGAVGCGQHQCFLRGQRPAVGPEDIPMEGRGGPSWPKLAAVCKWPRPRSCPLDKGSSHPMCTWSVFRALRKTQTSVQICVCNARVHACV